MKRKAVMVVPALLALVLILPASTANGQPGAWQFGPEAPFQFSRHDAVFVPGPDGDPWANKVYFLGGRTSSTTELPDIWRFDPLTDTYTDTGADMIEDVSNYNSNLIMDDGTGRGPAIYVIGGYDKDAVGTNIGTVQRYYPQSNVVEELPSVDDWPVHVAGYTVGGMGTGVVDDVIYVFGGWEINVAPYFYDGTWAFDPTAPEGQRWTDLGVALSVGRSYIQSAVQDGNVYCFGGIYEYVAGDLVPTDAVEVLDTADLGAGWTVLTPMPAPTAEGRGFGFDANTLGLDTPGQGYLYVVAGGDWPDGSAEVMEYDIANDAWNQAFPDLNEWRSNAAGSFIPLCTADPGDGLPGMWMFGGRWEYGCAPPFAPTEFYAMACGEEQTMRVGAIQGFFTVDYMGRSILRIHVYVEDDGAAALSDVLVGASIWVPDGGPFERSRHTKPSGNARFHWGSVASGTWTLCVDDLALDGYVYVPDDNVVTCMDWYN